MGWAAFAACPCLALCSILAGPALAQDCKINDVSYHLEPDQNSNNYHRVLLGVATSPTNIQRSLSGFVTFFYRAVDFNGNLTDESYSTNLFHDVPDGEEITIIPEDFFDLFKVYAVYDIKFTSLSCSISN